jgi:hypothetical protein
MLVLAPLLLSLLFQLLSVAELLLAVLGLQQEDQSIALDHTGIQDLKAQNTQWCLGES